MVRCMEAGHKRLCIGRKVVPVRMRDSLSAILYLK